jgi:hypothetical protein
MYEDTAASLQAATKRLGKIPPQTAGQVRRIRRARNAYRCDSWTTDHRVFIRAGELYRETVVFPNEIFDRPMRFRECAKCAGNFVEEAK